MKKSSKSQKSTSGIGRTPISPVDMLIQRLDMVAHEMESKWGAGVLTSLCAPDTSARFLRVAEKLNAAIPENDYDTIKDLTEKLQRGWRKMEAETEEAGHRHDNIGQVWYASDGGDIEYIICKSPLDAVRIARQMPDKAAMVFALPDIARILKQGAVVNMPTREHMDIVKKAKYDGILPNDDIPF